MCGAYMLCAVFRLARYNIISDDKIPTRIFFGFPTTLAGGTVAIWILLFLKYDPTYPAFGGTKLFGDSLHTPPAVWTYLPIALVVYGYLMASSLPMPKVGMTRNKVGTSIVSFLLLIGYACGFTMHYPEFIFWMPTGWAIIFLVWGQITAEGRSLKPPPLFPKRDEDKVLERPQEDLPDLVMDETPSGDGSPSAPAEPKP
jgi:CDP-diacylglycerol--serine O-phosphatidyltransferase